jgi:predicted transcriptional regulator
MSETTELIFLANATRRMDDLRQNISTLADVRTKTVKSLRNSGMTYSDIAREIGVTPQAVAKMAKRRTDEQLGT